MKIKIPFLLLALLLILSLNIGVLYAYTIQITPQDTNVLAAYGYGDDSGSPYPYNSISDALKKTDEFTYSDSSVTYSVSYAIEHEWDGYSSIMMYALSDVSGGSNVFSKRFFNTSSSYKLEVIKEASDGGTTSVDLPYFIDFTGGEDTVLSISLGSDEFWNEGIGSVSNGIYHSLAFGTEYDIYLELNTIQAMNNPHYWSASTGGSLFYNPSATITFGSRAPIPEPATMFLFATGLAGLLGARRRFKQPVR